MSYVRGLLISMEELMVVRLTTLQARAWSRGSPSQLKTADDCLRKWWFDKISNLPQPPPSEAMKRGTRVHALLEKWLLTSVRAGYWFMSDAQWQSVIMIGYTARMSAIELGMAKAARGWVSTTVDLTTAKAEGKFTIDTYAAPLLGIIDVIDANGVTDYKTTRDYKWIPSEEELRADPQCVSYMRYWFESVEGSPGGDGRYQHIYMNSSTGGVRAPLSFDVSYEENESRFRILEDKVAVLKHYSTAINSTDVPHDAGAACDKWGGCPYQNNCSAYRKNNLGGGDFMGLFDQVKEEVEAKGTERAKEVLNEYNDDIMEDLDQTLLKAGYSQDQIDGMGSIAAKARLATKYKNGVLTEADLKACRVNPPDGTPMKDEAPAPAAAYIGTELPHTGITIKDARGADLKEFFADRWGLSLQLAGSALKDIRSTEGWAAKELRTEIAKHFGKVNSKFTQYDTRAGRPLASTDDSGPHKPVLQNVKLVLQDVTSKTTDPPSRKVDAVVAEKAKEIRQATQEHVKTVAAGEPRVLMIGCVMIKGSDVRSFGDWIKPIVDWVQKDTEGVLWYADKYGEGKKAVASAMYECITKGGGRLGIDLDPLPGYMTVMGHPAADLCLPVLEDLYPYVIKGL